ncbi:hypothetical protein EV363DRAFT_1174953, partial [Boletus edulis]
LQHARWRSIHEAQSEPVEWIETQVLGPDVMDRHTLAQHARMAANAYQCYEFESFGSVHFESLTNHCIIRASRPFSPSS